MVNVEELIFFGWSEENQLVMVAMTDLAIDAGLFSDELGWFLDIHHSIEYRS